MKRVATILMLAVLTLSILSVFAIPVNAPQVTTPPILDWMPATPLYPRGNVTHADLECNPEWLKVRTATHVSHDTTIIVQGKDTFGQDIEAKAHIPACTPAQKLFPLIDVHSEEPVTFAKITAVLQQGGEHCNVFEIHTLPEYIEEHWPTAVVPKEEWLGTYHKGTGYIPTIGTDGFPVEPSNPDPLKVVINWVDKDNDTQPDDDEYPLPPPSVNSTITIKGLDQHGEVLEEDVTIPAGSGKVPLVIDCRTWSTVCTVWGGETGISYYIFTEPKPQRAILKYTIAVDHISVTADPKNILADGESNSTITITLLDIDGHEVHWTTTSDDPVEINVVASGGRVKPSLGITIEGCNTHNHTTLISDTNARIVKVSALAIVPAAGDHPEMQLTGSDIVCFDGINSVPYKWPADIVDIGGTGSGRHYAVFKRLAKGCNLISIPVIPDEKLNWTDIPCAGQCLISVATYIANTTFEGALTGTWLYYDFAAGTGDNITIVDGLAYWVKAEKPCTLVISGRIMDQYDNATGFGVPPTYFMGIGWNMVGVTSIRWIETAEYLESLNVDQALKLYGPIWVFRRNTATGVDGRWVRNPPKLMPTEGMWLFTYDGILAP